MKALTVEDTAIDLSLQDAPFQPGYTFTFINATGSDEVVQESDVEGSGYTTAATVVAGKSASAVITKQFIKLASAGSVIALGN